MHGKAITRKRKGREKKGKGEGEWRGQEWVHDGIDGDGTPSVQAQQRLCEGVKKDLMRHHQCTIS